MLSEYSDDLTTSEYTNILPHTHPGGLFIDPDSEFPREMEGYWEPYL
jgi:hypothetical protein